MHVYLCIIVYNIICTEPKKTKPTVFLNKKYISIFKHHTILTLKTRLKTLDNKSTFNIYINIITISIFRYYNILITLKIHVKIDIIRYNTVYPVQYIVFYLASIYAKFNLVTQPTYPNLYHWFKFHTAKQLFNSVPLQANKTNTCTLLDVQSSHTMWI